MMEQNVINMRNITKAYKQVKVLDGVNLSLQKGRIYGLVGLNGAGKTMLMNILAGVILPTEGTVEILGASDKKGLEKARRRMGFLIEEPIFYPNLDVRENLRAVQLIKGQDDKDEIEKIAKIVGLDGINKRKKKLSAYSLGMRQRYGIGAALVGDPEILILDEPTNGLDIEGLKEVRGILQSLQKEGVTMVISSHNLSDLYKVAEEFIFLREGKLVEQWQIPLGTERIYSIAFYESWKKAGILLGIFLVLSVLLHLGAYQRNEKMDYR